MNDRIAPTAERPLDDNIQVPSVLLSCLDQLVERKSRQTGERPAEVRRLVEIEILRKGIEQLQTELQP